MRVLTGAIAALALVASTGAHAQAVYLAEPAPAPTYDGRAYAAAPPVVVAPAQPYVAVGPPAAYAYAPEPYVGAPVVTTGRWCTIRPSGYRWCWTP
jgi:hypothetical protein